MTYIEFSRMIDQAKREVNSEYEKELEKIRNKAYELNKAVGFYGIAGMTYKEFLEAIRHYSYEERMKVAYSFFLHIKQLDNIIFDLRRSSMRVFVVKYCLREDARVAHQLDQTYDDPGEAIQASIDLESDPDVYTSWIEEDYK